MRRAFCLIPLFAAFVCSGCRVKTQETRHSMGIELLTTIAKKGVPDAELARAIAKLEMPPSEPPQYWSRIANDPGYGDSHRRRAVFQLFRRHVRVGMALSELAHLLDHPTWLRGDDVRLIDILAGHIPVQLNPDKDETVFVLIVLREPDQDTSGIYLRIAGKISLQRFRDLILNATEDGIGHAAVLEVGYSEGRRPIHS